MGYESKLAIVLWKPDYERLEKDFHNNCDGQLCEVFDEIGDFETPDETYTCLYSDWCKWYDSDPEYFPEVHYIMKWIKDVRHAYIRIGEEYGDVEADYQADDERGCDEEFYNFISVSAVIGGLNRFGIGKKKLYGVTLVSSDSGILRQMRDGESGFFESSTKVYDFAYTRNKEAYKAYTDAWEEEGLGEYEDGEFIPGTDSDDSEMLTFDEFNKLAMNDDCIVIQKEDYHLVWEFFETEVIA